MICLFRSHYPTFVSPLIPHPRLFPVYVLFISYLFTFPDFFRTLPLFVPRSTFSPYFPFVLRLFSVYSSFVFYLFTVCFPPSLCLRFIDFTLILHFFLICSAFVSFFFSFVLHLFSIYSFISFPFISPPPLPPPFALHSFTKPNTAVRARSRLNTVLSRDRFSARNFLEAGGMDVKAKRKVFRERLCTSYLLPR